MDHSVLLVIALFPTFLMAANYRGRAYLYFKSDRVRLEAEKEADAEKIDWSETPGKPPKRSSWPPNHVTMQADFQGRIQRTWLARHEYQH